MHGQQTSKLHKPICYITHRKRQSLTLIKSAILQQFIVLRNVSTPKSDVIVR